MPRIPRSRPLEDIFRLSQRYLYLRAAKLEAEAAFTAAAKPVREWLNAKDGDHYAHGEAGSEGQRRYRFAKPLLGADGKTYYGVELRRTQGAARFDPDEVLAFLKRKFSPSSGVLARTIRTVEVPDLDELYVLQQEGKITEAELRSLMHDPAPSWALWPIESADVTEEE